jgi:hypothetical protein
VEFEDGSSISVLENKATRSQKLQLEIEKVSKKVKSFKPRRQLFTLAFFKLLCAQQWGKSWSTCL